MSRTFYTSDPHISHEFLAKLRGFVTADGTGNTRAHDEWYRDMWCAHVTKRDTVWIQGDLTIGGKAKTDAVLEFFRDLPGTKHFISGNHDPSHPADRDQARAQRRFMDVFESVQPFGLRRIAVSNERRYIALSHFPYEGDHTDDDRFDEWRLKDAGRWLLHGHTHDPGQRVHGHQIHVGIDAWGRPVDELEIAAIITASEAGTLSEDRSASVIHAGNVRVPFTTVINPAPRI